MAAFSRGHLLRQQVFRLPASFIAPKRGHQSTRCLSHTNALWAKKAALNTPLSALRQNKASPHSGHARSTPAAKVTPPTYLTFAEALAQKPHPTLLYQAPSHTFFMFSSYSAGLFCFAYAGFSFLANYIYPPPGIASWVPVAFGGISFMMAGLGGWLVLGPARLVRSITAVPVVLSPSVGLRAAHAGPVPRALRIEVELRKPVPLPFLRARRLVAEPGEVVVPARSIGTGGNASGNPGTMDRPLTAAERWHEADVAAQAKARQLAYEKTHILTAPFRHGGRAFAGLFQGLRRAWVRDGFVDVRVRGKRVRMDVSGGWALDGGRGLARTVTVEARG